MGALAEEQIYDGTDELIRSDPDQLARWRPGPGGRFDSRVGSRWFLTGSVCERSAVKRSIIGAETAPNSRWAPAAQRSTFVYLQLVASSRVTAPRKADSPEVPRHAGGSAGRDLVSWQS